MKGDAMRTVIAVVAALVVALSLPLHAVADPSIVGVWRTIGGTGGGEDQGGAIFREDGTGIFISATWSADGNEEIVKMIVPGVASGTSDIEFKYTLNGNTLETTITKFGGMPVTGAPTQWAVELTDDQLTLSQPGKSITLERVA